MIRSDSQPLLVRSASVCREAGLISKETWSWPCRPLTISATIFGLHAVQADPGPRDVARQARPHASAGAENGHHKIRGHLNRSFL
jgi:hypothetical protein